jgi:hypothetical protein
VLAVLLGLVAMRLVLLELTLYSQLLQALVVGVEQDLLAQVVLVVRVVVLL